MEYLTYLSFLHINSNLKMIINIDDVIDKYIYEDRIL
jgi:hypothetical protein